MSYTLARGGLRLSQTAGDNMDTKDDVGRTSSVPELLARVDEPAVAEELFTLLYAELHRLAEVHMRRYGNSMTLGATTLLHEAYLRMIGKPDLAFPDRARFFAYASRAMRNLAIDYARSRRAQKRGRQLAITLNEELTPASDGDAEPALGRLCSALQELTTVDASLAELVDLHFFGGLSFVEIAALREVSERTVQRDWRKARMLLKQGLRESDSGSELPF